MIKKYLNGMSEKLIKNIKSKDIHRYIIQNQESKKIALLMRKNLENVGKSAGNLLDLNIQINKKWIHKNSIS
jgi:hypothetical protein